MLEVQICDDMLKPGVYLLTQRGEVVFIGRAKCLLSIIAAHRDLLSARTTAWSPIPRVPFDGFRIIACATDRSTTLLPELIALYTPRYNTARAPELTESPP